MVALKDLLASERGLVAISLMILSTVLFALGHLDSEQWLAQTKWVFVTYTASKTVTSTIEASKAPAPPTPTPAPSTT
jgi:hypothetical protein